MAYDYEINDGTGRGKNNAGCLAMNRSRMTLPILYRTEATSFLPGFSMYRFDLTVCRKKILGGLRLRLNKCVIVLNEKLLQKYIGNFCKCKKIANLRSV